MKKRLFVGIIFSVIIALLFCTLFACAKRTTEGEDEPSEQNEQPIDNEKNEEEVKVTRTVEIINGKTRSIKEYEAGTEIELKAELLENAEFVFWTENGQTISYEREKLYTVKDAAIIKAVYASGKNVETELDGGYITEGSVKVVLSETGSSSVERETSGAIYYNYKFILPVPQKDRYTFTGYWVDGERVTDAAGRSLGVYNGGTTTFVAVYEEKPYVYVKIFNRETGEEQQNVKAYLEDFKLILNADEVIDRECTGIVDAYGNELSAGRNFEVDLTNTEILCSDKDEIYIQRGNIIISFCDCDLFGVAVKNGNMEGTADQSEIFVSDATVAAFDLLGAAIAEYVLETEEADYDFTENDILNGADEEKRIPQNYQNVISASKNVFATAPTEFGRNATYTAESGLVLGISDEFGIKFSNHGRYERADLPTAEGLEYYYEENKGVYVKTADKEINAEKNYYVWREYGYDDYFTAAASLFGCEDPDVFAGFVSALMGEYERNEAGVSADTKQDRLKQKGAIYVAFDEEGLRVSTYVLPYVFKQNNEYLYAFVIIVPGEGSYLWLSDAEKAIALSNYEEEEYEETPVISVYGRCKLFEKSHGFEVSYFAKYREAYRLSVVGGTGAGKYALEEEVEIKANIPVGNKFVSWNTLNANGEACTLGYVVIGDERTICFIGGTKITYYDETLGLRTDVEKSVLEDEGKSVETMGVSATISLNDLVKLGIVVSGGAKTKITAGYVEKEFALTYLLDCMVNGKLCVDETGKTALIAAGFSDEDEDGVYEKKEFYDWNEAIYLAQVPKISHYQFENWQNSVAGSRIPSAMPESDVTLTGTFNPDIHKITVNCDLEKGKVNIGAGSITSGYYSYGSTIEFRLTAYSGYTFSKWLDIDNVIMSVPDANDVTKIALLHEPNVGVDIAYVFYYTVEREEVLTVEFTEREYNIAYVIAVWYDGVDVTRNRDFFPDGEYEEGYWTFSEARTFGSNVTLRDKYRLRSQEYPTGIPLIYDNNWTISEWESDDVKINTQIIENDVERKYFSMPKNDVIIRSTCVINSYPFGFVGQEGVKSYSVYEINGKQGDELEAYRKQSGYIVPYGSDVRLEVEYEIGYSIGDLQIQMLNNNVPVEFGYENKVDDVNGEYKYVYDLDFTMLSSDTRSATYLLFSHTNMHTITYYVNVDYLHSDEEHLLTDVLTTNVLDTKTVGGKIYCRVDNVVQKGEDVDITQRELRYETDIREADIKATVASAMYNMSNWKKMCGDDLYTASKMPDDDIWMYSDVTIKTYDFSIFSRIFNFETDLHSTDAKPTATVTCLKQNSETEEENYVAGTKYMYFTEIRLRHFDPIGYGFIRWDYKNGLGAQAQTETLDINTVTKDVPVRTSNGYWYKVNSADNTLSLFVMNDAEIEGVFDINKFTASLSETDTNISISSDGNEWGSQCSLDYGDRIMVSYLYSNLRGEAFLGLEYYQEGTLVEEFDSEFNSNTLSYNAPQTSANAVNTTSVTEFTGNVVIKINKERIKYKITYVVYPPADSLSDLSEPVEITEDENGEPFITYYNGSTPLLTESKMKELVVAKGMSTAYTMYSGWYDKTRTGKNDTSNKDLKPADGEGNALLVNGEYSATKSCRHMSYQVHPVFKCYLIKEYLFDSAYGLIVNANIKNTASYATHFGTENTEIELPSLYQNRTVERVGNRAFSGLSLITRITLPSSVKVIGQSAFEGCTDLLVTGLTDNITSVEAKAYDGCSKITSVDIGRKITNIGTNAFANLPRLLTINYNPLVDSAHPITLGDLIFAGSGSEVGGVEFVIGKNTSFVQATLFDSGEASTLNAGSNLKKVSFVERESEEEQIVPVYFAENAFRKSSISTFTMSERVEAFGTGVFYGCDYLKKIDFDGVSDNLTALSTNLFRESGVTEVCLSENIVEIGEGAFYGCANLISVYYRNENGLTNVLQNAFRSTNSKANKLVRVTAFSNKAEVAEDEDAAKEIRLENLSTLGSNAFYGCQYLTTVIIGGGTAETDADIGDRVFGNCVDLASVYYDFVRAKNKTEDHLVFNAINTDECALTLGPNVKKVPEYMFYYFNGVKTLTLSTGITYIGTKAFGYMENLTTLNYNLDGSEFTMGSAVFYQTGAVGLTINVGADVQLIKESTFENIANLRTLTVAENAEKGLTIEERAFASTGLTVVNLPNRNSIVIGEEAFASTGITEVNIYDEAPYVEINREAFTAGNNTRLASIAINAFGMNMTSVWGTLTTGKLCVSYDDENETYTGVLTGIFTTRAGVDFAIGRGYTFNIKGSSAKLEVTTSATVRGSLIKTDYGILFKVREDTDVIGYVYDSADMESKLNMGQYTDMEIDANATEEVVVSGSSPVTIAMDSFTVNNYLKFAGDVTFNATVTVASGKDLGICGKSVFNRTTKGKIKAYASAEFILQGTRYLNDGSVSSSDLTSASGYGLKVNSGYIFVGLTYTAANGYTLAYEVPTDGTLLANYDYTQANAETLALSGTGIFRSDKISVLTHYSGVNTSQYVANGSTGEIKFVGYSDFAAQKVSVVSLVNGSDKYYYGNLQNAFSRHSATGPVNPTYVLESDLTLTTALSVAGTNNNDNVKLSFNGKTVTMTDAGITVSMGILTLFGANLTFNYSSVGINHTSTSGGVVVYSGTVTNNDGPAIKALGYVTLITGSSVTSESGVAIEASYATLSGTTRGATYGVKIGELGRDNVGIVVNGGSITGTANAGIYVDADEADVSISGSTISSTSGTGIVLKGDDMSVSFTNTVKVNGVVGIHTEINKTVDTTNAAMNMGSNVNVNGTTAGMEMSGSGYYVLSGTIKATAEKTINSDTSVTGALVVKETTESAMRIVANGTINNTHANGDAVIYVGYTLTNHPNSYSYYAIDVEDATITGRIEQLSSAYKAYNIVSSDLREVYAYKNGSMQVFSNSEEPTGDVYEYSGVNRINAAGMVLRDEVVESEYVTDKKVRYLVNCADVYDALSGTGIVRYNGNVDVSDDFGGTLVNSSGAVTITANSAISGKIALKSNGSIVINTGVSVNVTGEIIVFDTAENDAITNRGTLTLTNKMIVPSGKSVNSYGGIVFPVSYVPAVAGEIKVLGGGTLQGADGATIDGTVTAGSGTTVTFLGDINVNKFTVKGATVVMDAGDTVTANNFCFDGTYTFAPSISGGMELADGANVTFTNALDLTKATVSPTATITFNLAGTEIDECYAIIDSEETAGIFGVWNIPTDCTFGDNIIYGKMTVGGSVDFGENVAKIGALSGYNGRLIMNNDSELSASELRINAEGAGLEDYGGNYVLSDETTIGVSVGSWVLFTKTATFEINDENETRSSVKINGADVNAGDGFATASINSAIERIIKEVYDYHGIKVGEAESRCDDPHEYGAVNETCGHYAYTGCVHEVKATLSTGLTFEIAHPRKDIYVTNIGHTFVKTNDGTHVCSVCGYSEGHEYTVADQSYDYVKLQNSGNFYIAETLEELTGVSGTQIKILAAVCSECRDVGERLVYPVTITEAELNAALPSMSRTQDRFVCAGYSTTRLAAEDNIGIITLDGNKYYVVEVNRYGIYRAASDSRYFVVIECDEEEAYLNSAAAPSGTNTAVTNTRVTISALGGRVYLAYVSANGSQYNTFTSTGEDTVSDFERELATYSTFAGYYVMNASGTAAAPDSKLKTIVCYTYYKANSGSGTGGVYYDMIRLKKPGSNSDTYRYALIAHACHKFTWDEGKGKHVCSDCGAEYATPHTMTDIVGSIVNISTGTGGLGAGSIGVTCYYYYCPICGEKEHIVLNCSDMETAADELYNETDFGIGTIEGVAYNKLGEKYTGTLHAELLETEGDFAEINGFVVRIGDNGEYYLTSAAYANGQPIAGQDYYLVFVKFANGVYEAKEKGAVLLPYWTVTERELKKIVPEGQDAFYVEIGNTETQDLIDALAASGYSDWKVWHDGPVVSTNEGQNVLAGTGAIVFEYEDYAVGKVYTYVRLMLDANGDGTADSDEVRYAVVVRVLSMEDITNATAFEMQTVTDTVMRRRFGDIGIKAGDTLGVLKEQGLSEWTVLDKNGDPIAVSAGLWDAAVGSYREHLSTSQIVNYNVYKLKNTSGEERLLIIK